MGKRDELVRDLEQHQQAVYTFFIRMGRQPSDAADLSQTTFLYALRGVERFRGESSYRTWLLGIARNVHRQWAKGQVRVPTPTGETQLATLEETGVDEVAIKQVLARVDDHDREVLVLRYVHDLASKEIAQLLGISDAAARQRISRAAAEFRALWGAR